MARTRDRIMRPPLDRSVASLERSYGASRRDGNGSTSGRAAPQVEHEVEARGLDLGFLVAHPDDERARVDEVALILGLAGEVELGRQHRVPGGLDLDVEMASAARVDARHDGLEAVASLLVRELVATEPEAPVVVLALGIGLPDVEQRSRDRHARGGEDRAGQDDPLALDP